ncbi:MAG: sugar-transfer associated ATP-grasp domain-containing protein, partial [Candidatus Krumholzibacteria bacterium]|nr:sugar-transfer associated ATP-grasp domain-containing protein [Candidatus Krumholzibacteria bacterium]
AHRLAYDPKLNVTYFADRPLKSKPRIFLDLLWWLVRFGEVNEYYYYYGFDRRQNARMEEYIDYPNFKRIRNSYNNRAAVGKHDVSYECLLRDKFIFQQVLKSLGFPTPATIAFSVEGRIHWVDSRRITGIEALRDVEHLDVFCKPLLGQCAEGVFHLTGEGGKLYRSGEEASIESLRDAFKDGYVIQEYVKQHPLLAAFHSHSVATLRLVTITSGKEIALFESCLKIGAGGIVVSNFAAGGLIGEADPETGKLVRDFYGRPDYGGGRVQKHPDSGIVFEGYQVPFYHEAVAMAKELHRRLYGLRSIGWDIAIGPDGPIVIEGNDNWELTQTPISGFRKSFYALLPDRGWRRDPVHILTGSETS